MRARSKERGGPGPAPLELPLISPLNLPLILVALFCSGCDGGLSLLLSLGAGAAVGTWWSRQRSRPPSLGPAQSVPALTAGQQRSMEKALRGELALVMAGEAVSVEREWMARNQLGGLLVSQWRLEEARQIYSEGRPDQGSALHSWTAFGRHEIDLLTRTPTQEHLAQIQQDRLTALSQATRELQPALEASWTALEGLCLIRMGRAREGAALISPSIPALLHCPSRVVYHFHLAQAFEHLKELPAALEHYRRAISSAPGSRLASEAQSRLPALGQGQGNSSFRSMAPQLPVAHSSAAPLALAEGSDEEPQE